MAMYLVVKCLNATQEALDDRNSFVERHHLEAEHVEIVPQTTKVIKRTCYYAIKMCAAQEEEYCSLFNKWNC